MVKHGNKAVQGRSSYLIVVIMLVVVALVSVSSFVTIREVNKQSRDVLNEALPIMMAADNLLVDIVNQETGIRGYIATANPRFLEAYENGKKQLEQDMIQLQEHLSSGNYESVEKLLRSKAFPQINTMVSYFNRQIEEVRSGHLQTAISKLDEGKGYMDAFRITHAEIRSMVDTITYSKLEVATKSANQAIFILIVGGLAVFGMGLTTVYLTRNANRMAMKLQESEITYREMAEELEIQNEEIVAQQEEQEVTLQKLTQRELELEMVSSFQALLTGFTDMQHFLSRAVPALTDALGKDAAALVLRSDEEPGRYDCVFVYGYPHDTQPFQPILTAPALQAIREIRPVMVERMLSDRERGLHGAFQSASDMYYPVLDPNDVNQSVMGLFVLTCYQRTMLSTGDSLLVKGLMRQFALALNAQLFNEERRRQALRLEQLNAELTEEKERIGKSRDFINLILNTSLEAMITCNSAGLVDFVNTRAQELFGTLVQPGHRADNVFGLISAQLCNPVGELLASKSQLLTEKFDIERGEERLNLELYATPIDDGNSVDNGYLFVIRDRTEEERISEMKNEFVSTVSHELRTPLSSVLGFIELMLNRELSPEKQKKYLTTIYSEANRLSNLINDFLDLQRMEAGKQNYHFQPVHLNKLVAATADKWKGKQTHTIRLSVEDPDMWVRADPDRMSQVLDNLMSNAIKYSPNADHVDITVSARGGRASIQIRDYGLGIPEDAKDKLFTKFYRVDNSDRRQIGGTGLGLSIVKEIVEAHDGTIRFESKMGIGSVFTIEMNIVSLPSIERSIVIIEDDETVTRLIAEALHNLGHPIVALRSAEQFLLALEKPNLEPPVLCIVDIALEGKLTGWEVLSGIYNHPTCYTTPIIVSTALDAPLGYHEKEVERYMKKPFTMERLVEVAKELLEKRRAAIVFPAQDVQQIAATLEQSGIHVSDMKEGDDTVEFATRKEET